MLRLQTTRVQQPQHRVAVNESNAIARGIVAGTVGSSNVYLRGFVPFAYANGSPPVPVASGIAVRGTAGMQQIARAITTTSDITLLVVGEVNSSTSLYATFGGLSHNGGTDTFTISNGNGTTAGNITGQVYLGGYRTVGGNINAPVGSTFVAVLRHRNNVDQSLWVNGVKDITGTTTWTGATVGNQYWGHYSRSTYAPCTLAVAWNRALSDAEIAQLSANPWQVLEPRRIWVPVNVGAGGGAVTGNLAASESGSDAAEIVGSVKIAGGLAASESGADTAALSGNVRISGSISAAESGADAAALVGAVRIAGDLASAESGQDAAAIQGSLGAPGISGTLAATETGSDSAALAGAVFVAGVLAALEAGGDTAAVSGQIRVAGALAATETGSDTASILGAGTLPAINGNLAATETGSDTAAGVGYVRINGTLVAVEVGSDSASIGPAAAAQPLSAPPSGRRVQGAGRPAAVQAGRRPSYRGSTR